MNIPKVFEVIPKGVILNKHNIDNLAVIYYFKFIFKDNEYTMGKSSFMTLFCMHLKKSSLVTSIYEATRSL